MTIKDPRQAYLTTVAAGQKRAAQSAARTLALSFLGGCYVGMGGLFALRAIGDLPAAWGASVGKLLLGGLFPLGLMLILLTGAELFTGNCLTLASAWWEKKISLVFLCRNWLLSWLGNFAGAAFFAWAMSYQSGLILETVAADSLTMPWAAKIVSLSNAKTALGWAEAVWRGILANWLVCLAVYIAGASNALTGKVLGLWPPVTAFVVMGAEHSVANMFFLPLGLFTGASPSYAAVQSAPALRATWGSFLLDNLIPVTIGNILGGALFVAGIFFLLHKNGRQA
jgi:formate/nitrite transporter